MSLTFILSQKYTIYITLKVVCCIIRLYAYGVIGVQLKSPLLDIN